MVNDKLLSLKEAAQHLEVSILDLVSMSKRKEIPFQIVNGDIYYSQDDLIKEETVQPVAEETLETIVEPVTQPPSRSPRKKIVTENKPRKKLLTPEEFTINYINQFNEERNRRGVHVRYDGYNREFRKTFPEFDPIKETQRMENEGLIRIFPMK